MEVKLYTRNDYMEYRSLTSAPDRAEAPAAKEIRQENYDTVTIRSDFSRMMAQETDGEDAASQRIFSLQQQIATGTYQLDARRIAECMLERRSQPGLF